jgi:hypothetical protein
MFRSVANRRIATEVGKAFVSARDGHLEPFERFGRITQQGVEMAVVDVTAQVSRANFRVPSSIASCA